MSALQPPKQREMHTIVVLVQAMASSYKANSVTVLISVRRKLGELSAYPDQ